jgi:hypothetical protein
VTWATGVPEALDALEAGLRLPVRPQPASEFAKELAEELLEADP